MKRALAVTTSWLMTAPSVVAAAWLLVGVPLLVGHAFWPAYQVPAALVLATAMLFAVRRLHVPELPWWAAAATLLVVAFVVGWDVAHASQNLIVRRDPGPYGLIAHWIGTHGTMTIPDQSAVFGHDSALTYDSPGFYTGPGHTVQPQFQSGPALVFAPGVWIAGLTGGLAANAVVAGLAVLAVAGLVARFAKPGWVPFAALVLSVVYPDTHVARSPYSESLDQLLLFGGLSLLYAAIVVAGTAARSGALPLPALTAIGAVLGSASVARLDAYADLLPIAAVIVLFAGLPGRRPLGRAVAFAVGFAVGIGVGVVDDRLLHDRYVHDVPAAIGLLAAGGIALAAATVVAVVAVRWRPVTWWAGLVPAGVRRWAPAAAATVVVAAGVLGWLVRPAVITKHTFAGDHAIPEVALLQQAQHLPVDGTRTYAEWSMSWVTWWFGIPALILAIAAAGWLAFRHLRGADLPLLPFTLVALAAAVIVFHDPKAAGDHPWVERRFVPVVLPAVVVGVVYVLSRVRGHAWCRPPLRVLVALSVALPTIAATAPLWATSTEHGQLAAIRGLCHTVGPNAAVVFTDDGIGQRIAQTMRDLCDVPTARLRRGSVAAAARRLEPAVTAAGRSLVFLGGDRQSLGALAPDAQHVLHLRYPVDQRMLLQQPTSLGHETFDVWLARPSLAPR